MKAVYFVNDSLRKQSVGEGQRMYLAIQLALDPDIMVLHIVQKGLKYGGRIKAIDAGKEIYADAPEKVLSKNILKRFSM